MKIRTMPTLMCCVALFKLPAMGQGNLVQNGNFNEGITDWTGMSAYVVGVSGVPGGGNVAEGSDVYQIIPTVIGDEYQISLYAATQIDWGQYTVAVDINGDQLGLFQTPPYISGGDFNLQWGSPFISSFTASSANTRLEFVNVAGADGNMWLANVDTQAVPEASTITLVFIGASVALSKAIFPRLWRVNFLSGNSKWALVPPHLPDNYPSPITRCYRSGGRVRREDRHRRSSGQAK
jgi:hypothetical protein